MFLALQESHLYASDQAPLCSAALTARNALGTLANDTTATQAVSHSQSFTRQD